MVKIISSFVLFFLSLSAFTQSDKIDSLKNETQNYFQSEKKTFSSDTTAINNLILISQNYFSTNYDSAFHYATKAIELAKSSKWKNGEVAANLNMANVFYKVSYDFNAAIPYFEKVISHYEDVNKSEMGGYQTSLYYYYLSQCYSFLGNKEKAIEEINKSLVISEKIDHYAARINAYNTLGNLNRELYRYDKALEHFLKCLELINEEDARRKNIIYGNIGLAYAGQSNFEKAIDFYKKAIVICDSIDDKRGLIRHYTNSGNSYRNMGELDLSIEVLQIAFKVAEELNDQYSIANIYSSLAIVFNIKGDYEIALENNFKSLEIYRSFNDVKAVANILANIGLDYQFSGNLLLAFEYHNKSIELIEESGLINNGASLGNIALIYNEYGSFEKALEIQFEVLKIAEELNAQSNKALCLGNIGGVYHSMKDYEKALQYYLLSYDLSIELNMNSTAANCLSDIGNLHLYKKEYKKAIEYYDKAINQYEKMDAKYNLSLAYGNLCKVYTELKMFDKAIEVGEIALDNAIKSGNPDSKKVSSRNIYLAHYGNEDYNNALHALSLLRSTITNGIEMNYLSFSEKERENYFLSIENDLANYYDFGSLHFEDYPSITDTMFNLALSTKGLSLKSSTFIRQSIINSGDTLLIKDYDSFITNKKKAAENYSNGKRNKELEEQIILQERELVERSGAFSDFNNIKNIDWKIIRDGLTKGEVAIEFIHFRSEIDSLNHTIYAALIVKKESEHPEVVRLCTEEDLTSILGVFQGNNNSFVRKVYGIKSKSEKELYKKIWEPLNKHLEGVKRVYYSPSGLLHKISFAALSDGNDMYLCDQYELFQQSSTSKLASSARPNYNALDNFMLIGGVQYNSTSTRNEVWSYLPGTKLEIASIARFLKQKKHTVNLFEGLEAKESTLKSQANQADILHVSTHGFFFTNPDAIAENRTHDEIEYVEHMNFRGTTFFDSLARNSTSYMNWNFVGNKNPLMRSGLVLAGANDVWQRDPFDEGEDGVLTAQEVSNLDLSSTKLVVLSACETGLGDIKGSEGVFGLQRAFKMAGAHYLIMSLWQVPDNETAEFMQLFYKNLTKKKDITLAFNLAQKEMRGKYDPYYWAAFVLVD